MKLLLYNVHKVLKTQGENDCCSHEFTAWALKLGDPQNYRLVIDIMFPTKVDPGYVSIKAIKPLDAWKTEFLVKARLNVDR